VVAEQGDLRPETINAGRKVFGFAFSPHSVAQVADAVSNRRRTAAEGVGLVITSNIDSIVLLNRHPKLVAAYASAEIITCDGFPLFYYARLRRAAPPAMGYGFDITERLFRHSEIADWHRLFFVTDSEATNEGLRRWAQSRGLPLDMLAFSVPPFGFERDQVFCESLARSIAHHRTTILTMGVGAPKSEVFIHSHRHLLPPCWALCVGQAVRMEAGEMQRVPALPRRLHLVWLWRISKEPKRLIKRYVVSGATFAYLAIRELLHA
jgi:N-acetylglucosaminyldiphosphoundecaprenol N-acetyl-beta-D-mannosaminyltransferase